MVDFRSETGRPLSALCRGTDAANMLKVVRNVSLFIGDQLFFSHYLDLYYKLPDSSERQYKPRT